MDSDIDQTLQDFPPGPLSPYRKSASFKWKEIRLVMEGKDSLLLKVSLYPIYSYSVINQCILHVLFIAA